MSVSRIGDRSVTAPFLLRDRPVATGSSLPATRVRWFGMKRFQLPPWLREISRRTSGRDGADP